MPEPRHPDFRLRSFEFARRALAFCETPGALRHGEDVRRQLRRAAMSIGANVEEAKGAQSKRDFLAKMSIALSEAREAYYWLRLLGSTTGNPDPSLTWLLKEIDEMVAILTVTVRTTRARLEEREEADRRSSSGTRPRRRK